MKISLVQLKRKKLKSGAIPIYLRITENRKSRYASTGISVKPKYWNAKEGEVRKSHNLYKQYNAELAKIKLEVENKKSELRLDGELDSATLKHSLKSKGSETLKSYSEAYIERLKVQERFWEYKHVRVALNDIRELGLINTQLSKVDNKFLDTLQNHMLHEKHNKPNTVRNKFQRFRGLITQAYKEGLIKNNPFSHFERIKREKVARAKLGNEEINRIISLDLEEGAELWHTRNYFMFSFYMAGIRFSDLCTLMPNNIVDGRLKYEMRKTGGKKNIKLLKPALKILTHYNTTDKGYIFPILDKVYQDEFTVRKKISSKNVVVNRYLKRLAKLAEIDENLSFHISRHSFANFALQNGMNIYSISKALAHSNLKTTEVYLKSFDEEMLDKDMEELFN